jgi:protein-S-isoprenylcysteine O-methyltransferase Ste14
MVPSLPQILFLLVLGGCFVHFLLAGARTFAPSRDDDRGSGWSQFSFILTGTLAIWWLGIHVPIHLHNGIASAALLVGSLALYEWTRHVIWGRRLHLAWSGHIPDSLCEKGPYAYIRHPIYASYVLAFVAALVALPTIAMLLILLFNATLFTHAAFSDERSMANSALASEYAQYRERTGMFFPRFKRRNTVI